MVKQKGFLEAVNQLKKTSDCINIDPPGPGQNLEKGQKNQKTIKKFEYFLCFYCKNICFLVTFLRACPLRGRAPSGGALGRAPPPFSRVEILKKFTRKSVPENSTLFFGKNIFLGYFTYQNALKPI